MVSLLKSLYGDAATKENGFAFDYLPKVDRDYSWTHIWDDMYNGKVKGMMAFGMNGVMIGPDTNKNINALKKADWLVVGEIYPDETSEFWRAPGITADEQKNINTTVYRLPCAGFAEKDGSMTNSARWVTWKYAAVPPPGQARLDQDIVAQIFLRVRDLYKKEGGKFPDPILNLSWAYADAAHPPLSQVAMELNGKALADLKDDATGQVIKAGQQLPGFAWLKDDGTTMCGNWIYSGSWTEAGSQIQRRGTEDPSGMGVYPNWAWSWPANRRVLYNRASCNPDGKAVGSGSQANLVERSRGKMGRQRRAGLQARLPSERSHGAVHHESGRRGAIVRSDRSARGRAVPGTLRTDRKPDQESAASRSVE